MMGLLLWVIFGGLVGWVASLVMGTDARQGILLNVILGVAGAFVGGFLASLVLGVGITGFNLYSFLVALGGALLLVYAGRLFNRSATVAH